MLNAQVSLNPHIYVIKHSFLKATNIKKGILHGRHFSWFFKTTYLLRLKKQGFCLILQFIVSLFHTDFNLESKNI